MRAIKVLLLLLLLLLDIHLQEFYFEGKKEKKVNRAGIENL